MTNAQWADHCHAQLGWSFNGLHRTGRTQVGQLGFGGGIIKGEGQVSFRELWHSRITRPQWQATACEIVQLAAGRNEEHGWLRMRHVGCLAEISCAFELLRSMAGGERGSVRADFRVMSVPRLWHLLLVTLAMVLGRVKGDNELMCTCSPSQWAVPGICGQLNQLEYSHCSTKEQDCDNKGVVTNCKNATTTPKQAAINIVTHLEDAIQFKILVANGSTISVDDPSTRGVTRHLGACSTNKKGGGQQCEYTVQWKSRCGTRTEDQPKYSCLNSSQFLQDNNAYNQPRLKQLEILGGLNINECEFKVCRLLCTLPSFEAKDYQQQSGKGKLELLEKTNGQFGMCDSGGKHPDSCYKLKGSDQSGKVHVGEELMFTLEAKSDISDDDIFIEAAVEPGIPLGMHFQGDTSSPGPGSKVRTVRWTPRPGQHGDTHIASFVAYTSTKEFCTDGHCAKCPPDGGRVVRYIHILIEVMKYETFWQFGPLTNVKMLQVERESQTDVKSGEEGTDIVFSMVAGQEVEGLELMCKSNVKCMSDVNPELCYQPAIELYNASIQRIDVDMKTKGRCDEKSCSNSTTQELGGWDGFAGAISQPSKVAENEEHQNIKILEFRYKAVTRRDEGYTKRWCFSCSDSGGMYPPAIQCISIVIRVCEVFVESDETLESITRKYHLDRNWRRLWNFNTENDNPYLVLHGDTTLRYGAVYTVRAGDSLITIAARFETTIRKLLTVNPHIVVEDEILLGQDICVLPCTNRAPPSHFHNSDYSP
jgi:hypothetical protein